MFPDQNQPQPQNDPAVAGPSPVYDTPPAPVSPAPFEPAPASPQPMTLQPADPMQPAPPAPEPVAFSPATPAAEPVAAPMGPMGDPLAPQPAPAPVAAPVVDSSQLGYVPPAMPMNPAGMAPISANTGKGKGGKFAKIRVIIAVVVGLAVLSGGGILLKDTLFTGSSVKVGDLVEETQDGVTFKRPKQWAKSSNAGPDIKVAFTEDGKPTEEADQGVLLSTDSLPYDLKDLSASELAQVSDSVKKSISDESQYKTDSCKEVGDVTVTDKKQAGYELAYQIEVTCNKFTGRNLKAKMKAVIALGGTNVHGVSVVAIDKTWDKSGDAFDEILNTFKPAE